MPGSADQFYREVSESIKLVFDLTSRIDERVKILVEQHNEANHRIDKLVERQENILSRISVLENKNGTHLNEDIADLRKLLTTHEIKLGALEVQSSGHANKWKLAGDFVFKALLTILGCILA